MKKLKLKPNSFCGKLIVFEGTDGAGKTTLIELTKGYLESLGQKVLCVKQPTDMSRKTKLFQKMMYSENHNDIDYRAVQLLTMSDRVQHCFEVISKALENGETVVCDRYVYTSLVNMLARGYVKEKWFYCVAKNIIKPTVVFLAYVSPEIAIERIRQRPEEKDKYLNVALLYSVAERFKKLAKKEKFIVLDTNNQANDVFELVKKTLIKRGVVNA